ncbi:MAG TPA: phospholipase D-like domain-containing protein [Ktedonobacterales bacterium]|nr:phospholipase D-like domain-containing protein [Ktedonobacterales bacterium]
MANSSTTFSANGLTVYFQSRRAQLEADLPTHLSDFIAATQHTLDCAIYDLREPKVLQALSALAKSGKRLRIAYDASKERRGGLSADPKPAGSAAAIQAAGLMPHATAVHNGGHLMHDKFLVRDGAAVWTGSANFTAGGLGLQDNNCLVIESAQMASAYTATFEGLLAPHHQHASKSDTPATPSVTVHGTPITPFFTPAAGEGIENSVIKALSQARSVRVLAFLVSDQGILDALARFQPAGMDIRGVFDPGGMADALRYKKGNLTSFWFTKDPRFVAAPSHAYHPGENDFMHNKVLIVDDHLVVTGSYNFSENAEANDENVLVIESRAVAAAFLQYFDTLYATYKHEGKAYRAGARANRGPFGFLRALFGR